MTSESIRCARARLPLLYKVPFSAENVRPIHPHGYFASLTLSVCYPLSGSASRLEQPDGSVRQPLEVRVDRSYEQSGVERAT